jgi:hypothetical protein
LTEADLGTKEAFTTELELEEQLDAAIDNRLKRLRSHCRERRSGRPNARASNRLPPWVNVSVVPDSAVGCFRQQYL